MNEKKMVTATGQTDRELRVRLRNLRLLQASLMTQIQIILLLDSSVFQ